MARKKVQSNTLGGYFAPIGTAPAQTFVKKATGTKPKTKKKGKVPSGLAAWMKAHGKGKTKTKGK